MYAIIESGGGQFKVAPGDIVTFPRIDKEEGNKVTFSKVLFFRDADKIEVGKPYLKKIKVEGELLKDFRGKKVISFVYKRRKNYQRKKGFRRELSEVRITQIKTDSTDKKSEGD